jgi:integrating conjugative element protein (TIGR03749 family)
VFKKRLTVLYFISAIVCQCQISFADPLLLSDAEMQKLKMYFPNDAGDNHFVWNGDPIPLNLPIGKEKRLVFPTQVTVDVKGALTSDQLQIIDNDKSLYLTALKPFSHTRVYVTLNNSQEVVLFDLQSSEQGSTATTYVDIKQNNNASPLKANTEVNSVSTTLLSSGLSEQASADQTPALSEGDTYVALTRYAWQQLYAPLRLLKNPLGIGRVPMKTDSFQTNLIYGDKAIAHPLASWSFNNFYITVISLRNQYPHSTTINVPQDLCGNWVGAVLYPRTQLSPAGNKLSDSATLFVLSREPFNKATEVCHVSA